MRVQQSQLARSLTALRIDVHRGQPIVVAFATGLELQESPALDRIRAELRGLGAALFLVAAGRAFTFRPDDEVEPFGSRAELDTGQVRELRQACALRPNPGGPRELSLLVADGDGHPIAKHTMDADDGLRALADALSVAGRAAISTHDTFLLSRREVVLASLVGAFALLAVEGCHSPALHQTPTPAGSPKNAQTLKITLNVNGQPHQLELEPRVSLLDALRERLALTGSKKGCDHGQCGACTVLVAGRRVNACLTLAVMVGDAPVTTIEGLAQGEALHPMQDAFVAEDALQCGYCTPGQIMSAVGLLRENRAHSDAEVREHMSGNICRCGAYTNIVAAIQRARAALLPG
ncbi:MAG TPA: (2Fe-2S)-binding protein [Polyangiaceae bacterium]|jgi:xanthine dehydrogenase YagT iron-sulfur-binding subunit|nr:(2Fe-2S)-binding protein [Polyangiaceae bacterium]